MLESVQMKWRVGKKYLMCLTSQNETCTNKISTKSLPVQENFIINTNVGCCFDTRDDIQLTIQYINTVSYMYLDIITNCNVTK